VGVGGYVIDHAEVSPDSKPSAKISDLAASRNRFTTSIRSRSAETASRGKPKYRVLKPRLSLSTPTLEPASSRKAVTAPSAASRTSAYSSNLYSKRSRARPSNKSPAPTTACDEQPSSLTDATPR
jgi:hypothetical protein